MKKFYLLCLLFVVLLVMGAGCVGDNTDTKKNETGATVVPTVTGTAGPAATTTATTAPVISADGPVYNVSGASVVLVDALAGKSGVNGLSAAANTSGTLVLTASATTGTSVTVGSDAVPVYSAMDIADKNGNFAGLITLNFVVPAAFVEEKTNEDPTQIVMVHSEGGIYKPLDTFYLGVNKTAGEYYYASMTKSFSPFAICSLSDADVPMTVYDLTQIGSYPEFIGDVNGAAKTQMILKNALNTVLTEISTNEEATVEDCLENAIEAARSTVEDVKLTPYNDESGGSSQKNPEVPNKGGNTKLEFTESNVFIGVQSSSTGSAGVLTVSNVKTVSEESPIEDIDVSEEITAEVYQTMNIAASGVEGKQNLEFSVPTKFLTENNWAPEDVALLHQMANGKWEILPTSYDPDTKIFTSRAPLTFSPFAVAKVGARNINEDLGNLEMTVLKISSSNVVESTSVLGDYNLGIMAQVALPSLAGPDADMDAIDGLAETWVTNTDNTSWTFTLDESYVWSDGVAVTGEDVKWTFWDYYKNHEKSSFMGNVTDIETDPEDPKSVTFELSSGDPNFYSKFVTYNVLPKHIWSTITNPTEYKSSSYVGCGPYYIKNIDLNSYVVTFSKNPHWNNDDKPYYDIVEIHQYEDENAAVMSLSSADTYWVYSRGYPNGKLSSLPSNMEAEMLKGSAGSFPFLGFNMNTTKNSVSMNLAFRQAVSYALNYPQMQQNPDYGGGKIGTYGFVPTAYDPQSGNYAKLTYDTGKACKILDDAGFTIGSDGWRIDPATGQKLTVKLLTDTSAEKKRWGQYIEIYLEELNIDVDLVSLGFSAGSGPWLDAKNAFDYDLVVVVVTQKALNNMGHGYAGNYFAATFPIGTGTLSNVDDTAFNALYTELGTHEKQSDAWYETGTKIMDYYRDYIPGIAIQWRETYQVHNTEIGGWILSGGMGYLNIDNLVSIRPKGA